MALLLCSVLVLFLMNQGLTEAAYYHCYSTENFTSSSDYGELRESVLDDLPSYVTKGGGCYYASTTPVYTNSSASPIVIGLCRADQIAFDKDACSICIQNCSSTIMTQCPVQKEVIAWGEDAGCIVRYAPHDFSSTDEAQPSAHSCNSSDIPVSYLQQFGNALANLTTRVAERAAYEGTVNSFSSYEYIYPRYFATEESELVDLDLTIYALGLCLPTLDNCTACLQAAANQSEKLCNGKKGAAIFRPSCMLRYELYRFYESIPSPSPPPPPPLSPPPSSTSNVTKEGRNSRRFVTAVAVPMILIAFIVVALMVRVLKKRELNMLNIQDDAVGAETTGSCLEFNLETIRVATNDFSAQNKLGQGGFGAVYKGRLPNGREIAVKRLSLHSARGEVEFKNEVQLVARLHHKNLIRLLGYNLQGRERILIYELALNGSLDRFLFDPVRREHLSWEIRYNIIKGIARGMLYLHEESQLRIIHRDLKASNVLLDESMTPKISDFGTARLFVEDQGSASRIVGTYGYMAPEYAKLGKISVKIDVFSFGVLVLEIISGKKNSASDNQKHIEHLLSKAWKFWTRGKLLKLIDPILLRGSGQTDEMIRCMHIALLCVQENATRRPAMNSVILMLEGHSQRLPPPLKPAYFMHTGDDDSRQQDYSVSSETDSGQQTSMVVSLSSSSGFSSVNEVSITESYPEPR